MEYKIRIHVSAFETSAWKAEFFHLLKILPKCVQI
jgi:hypothetical protein